MKERIREIYKEKSDTYLSVLEEFGNAGVEYVLLNLLVADDNPGDLDILFCNCNQNVVTQILIDNGFSYYTEYESGQHLWNKYLKGKGFVQFHIYESLRVCGREYFPLSNIDVNLRHDFAFHFFVFIIETLYKGILRIEQYKQYKQFCSIELLKEYVKVKSPIFLDSVEYIVECYEENEEINPSRRNYYLWQGNRICKYQILLWKSIRRLKNLFRQDNIPVLFIGVDGAGKSTQIESVSKIFSKGGLFPVTSYMGLKNSVFSPKQKTFFEAKDDAFEVNPVSCKLPLSFLRFCKLFLYWFEYNIKYLFKIRLHPYGSQSVYLIDRCYLDLLFYYPYSIVRKMFICFSFMPNKIVFLTGNADVLYNRKQEMKRPRFDANYFFYKELVHILEEDYSKDIFEVDSSHNNISEITKRICDFIMEK